MEAGEVVATGCNAIGKDLRREQRVTADGRPDRQCWITSRLRNFHAIKPNVDVRYARVDNVINSAGRRDALRRRLLPVIQPSIARRRRIF